MKFGMCLMLMSMFGINARHHIREQIEQSDEVLAQNLTVMDLRGSVRRLLAFEVASTYPNSNVVCSPLSALLPLGKLALGAGMWSLRELLEAIGYSQTKFQNRFKSLLNRLKNLDDVELVIVSRIFLGQNAKIKKDFLDDTRDVFNSSVETVNYNSPVKTAESINQLVKDKTKGMITEIIRPGDINPTTSMILLNAVYFEGEWLYKFHEAKLEPFKMYVEASRGDTRVLMMSLTGIFNYVTSDFLRVQVIEIPYKNKMASFIVVLPKEPDGLQPMLRELRRAPDLLNSLLSMMQMTQLSLKIPKFKITSELNLKTLYHEISVKKIFQEDSDLTEIIHDNPVFVSQAVQKVVIEVNETGTTAAAGSAMHLLLLSGNGPVRFHADHPFLFFVLVNKQQLFSGIFANT